MTMSLLMISFSIVAGAIGTYWLCPIDMGFPQPRRAHYFGEVSSVIALVGILVSLSPPGPILPTVFFYIFSGSAIVGALLTVTSRNPIYSALWFASVVLSTCGLFLLASAPFLAAGTIIVYAGAIIVTFLFVIMLAQMEGKALYDRAARARARHVHLLFVVVVPDLLAYGAGRRRRECE